MLKPINNKVIVKEKEQETVTTSGIILKQDSRKAEVKFGTVIALEEGNEEIKIKVGDIIVFDKYEAQNIMIKDEQLLAINYDRIIAIYEEGS